MGVSVLGASGLGVSGEGLLMVSPGGGQVQAFPFVSVPVSPEALLGGLVPAEGVGGLPPASPASEGGVPAPEDGGVPAPKDGGVADSAVKTMAKVEAKTRQPS